MDALVGRLREGVGGASAHAYLFCGPAGTGKRSLASVCARALNCAGSPKPCDACPSCLRYLNATHPDHIVVASEKSIGVDDVRALIDRISVRPYEGGRHTVVIERADSLTQQAQNALLKTLEEPPGDAVFFLLAEKTAPLLSTVRSRVRLIRFSPLSESSLREALERLGMPPERARLLAGLSQGGVGRALALDADADYWALRERVVGALTALKGPADVSRAFAFLKDDRTASDAALGIMEQIALSRMREQEAGERIDPALLPEGIGVAGDGLLRGVLNMRRMLGSNVSWQSALEMMFFDLIKQRRILS